MAGGSVELQVSLALGNLARDAKLASDVIKRQLKDPQISVGVDLGSSKKSLFEVADAFQQGVSDASLYTQALGQVGQQLGQAGAQINQFTQQATNAAIAFDSATAKVATLSDNAQGIASDMRDLSKELDFQANSTDLLTASYDVLSSGFSDAADISGILKASVNGAIGGFSDVGTVADATTTILNSYGDALGESATATEKAAKIVDILAQTQDKGKITIDQYAGQIGRVASIAAGAGLSLEELSAAIATATAKGVPAESSISGIRQAIVNLTKPTAEAQAKLESFGIANAAATLKSEGLIGVLTRLQEAGATNTDLGKIFSDVDALATIVPIAGQNLDDYRANLESMDGAAGKAAKSAAAVSASFEGQTTAAFNQANEALVSLGNGVKGAVIPLVAALTFLIENFNNLPEPIKESIGVAIALSGGLLTLAGALAGLAAALPVVLAGLKALGVQGLFAGSGAAAAGAGAVTGAAGIKAMTVATGGLLLKLGLITLAMAAVQSALSRFEDGGESFKGAAGKIEKSLIDLQTESKKTRAEIESVLPSEPPPTDFIDGVIAGFNQFTGLDITTNAEKQIGDLRAGLEQLQTATDSVIATGREFAGSQEDAKKVQETFTAAIAAANEELKNLDPAKIGTTAYNELSTGVKATVKQLEAEKAAFERRAGIVAAAGAESTAAGDAIADSQKKAAEAIAKTTEAYAQNAAEQENFNKLRTAEIKTSVAQGITTEADGQKQILDQDKSFNQKRLSLAENQARELRDLLSSTTDPKELKELNGKILEADSTVADARLAIAENLAKEREAAEKAALERIEAANRESEARITQSQQARIGAVKQAQLDGTRTAEEAAAAIAQIEQDGIAETVAARRSELAQVQSLRAQGLLSAEEARDRELGLNEEIGSLNLERIDKEIAAQEAASAAALKAVEEQKKAVLDAIDAAQQAATAPLESAQIGLDIAGGANNLQGGLLSAQLEQQQALAQVEQARFDSAIQKAKLAGNEVQAEKLKLDQIKAQQAAQEAAFEVEKQQLTLAQEQRRIDLERQQIAAQIAAIEAEVAIQKAIANGASESEIANLQTILGLRQKQIDQLGNAEKQQQQLNGLESSTLAARQTAGRIQGQTAAAAQQQTLSDARKPKTETATGEAGDTERAIARSGLSAEEREKLRIQNGQRFGFNAAGSPLQQLKTKMPGLSVQDLKPIADLGGLGNVVQEGSASVVAKLDELRGAIEVLANTPRCLTVSAPDPVGAVGQILADVGKASFRRAKL